MINLIILLIYILGVITSIAFYIYAALKNGDDVTIGDMGFFIFTSIFSWITFILLIFTICSDIVLIHNKKYKK